MTDSKLTLYSDSRFFSPWVLTVWAWFKEKNVPFEVETVDLAKGEARKDDYVRGTLTAKVPSLRHGDLWIGESIAILEYLEEAFAPPAHRSIYPADRHERARDRQILSWLRSDLMELRRCMPFEGIFLPSFERPAVSDLARTQADVLLRAVASRKPESRRVFTAADYELAIMMRRLLHYGHDLAACPGAAAYSDAIWSLPAIQSFVSRTRL